MEVVWISLPDNKGYAKRQVLEELGYKTFDAIDVVNSKKIYTDWNAFMLDRLELDWSEFLKDYQASVLTASLDFVPKLLASNPNLKVIMEDVAIDDYQKRFQVYQRFIKFIRNFRFNTRLNRGYVIASKGIFKVFGGDTSPQNIENTLITFKKDTIQIVPKDQLLIINKDTSWQDVGNFLNKPVPDTTFPFHSQKNSYWPKFKEILFSALRKNWLIYLIYFGTLTGLIIYLVFFY